MGSEMCIRDSRYLNKQEIVYAMTLSAASNEQIVGAVGLAGFNNGLAVLGYWVGVHYWGHGYAFEAAQGLISHCKARHGLTVVEVRHLIGNDRSQSVVEKLGIKYIADKVLVMHGRRRPVRLYRSAV